MSARDETSAAKKKKKKKKNNNNNLNNLNNNNLNNNTVHGEAALTSNNDKPILCHDEQGVKRLLQTIKRCQATKTEKMNESGQ